MNSRRRRRRIGLKGILTSDRLRRLYIKILIKLLVRVIFLEVMSGRQMVKKIFVIALDIKMYVIPMIQIITLGVCWYILTGFIIVRIFR